MARSRKRSQSGGSILPVPIRKDARLQQHTKTLKQQKEHMNKLDRALRRALELPSDRSRSFAAKAIRAVVPSFLIQRLPSGIVEMVGEEEDVLQFVERSIRESNNNIQQAIRGIAKEAVQFRIDLEQLAAHIAEAEEKNWTARQLQDYIAQQADIQVFPEVAELLDRQIGILTPEEEEARRQELLVGLKNTLALGQHLQRTVGEVCNASLEVYQKSTIQYYQYTRFQDSAATIRDAAKELLTGNEAMYASKEALAATFQVSLQAVETALEGAQMAEQYRIASVDMAGLLEAGATRLRQKVKALPQALAEIKMLPSGETEDADPKEESKEDSPKKKPGRTKKSE